jgi:hypothetical protein
MAVDFDAKLTDLAAEILRDAAQVYSRSDVEAWLSGYNPVLAAWNAGMFGTLEMTSSFQAVTGAFEAITGSFPALGQQAETDGQETLKQLFRLPRKLPAVHLPPPRELAEAARSAPIMVKLEELAKWLGREGTLVTRDDALHDADAAEAAQWLGIRPETLSYLWEHALVTGWFDLVDEPDQRRSRAVLGETAYRWGDDDISGTLHVWATVFASVLAMTLEVAAERAPDAARRLNFGGQGVALGIMLFLARSTGLTTAEASRIVRYGAIGNPSTRRARKAWEGWVREFGDPGQFLLSELAALHAVKPPGRRDGVVALAPLAQWALREQFKLDKISVTVVDASMPPSVSAIVGLVGGMTDAEFNAEFSHWLSRQGPKRAAQELLLYAGSASARARLTAVSLVKRIGPAARPVWVDALKRPELRGYAMLALAEMAANLPEPSMPRIPNPDPDGLAGVATDLLALVHEDEPDPDLIEAHFAEAIPPNWVHWAFSLMARSSHPDIIQLLEVLSRFHPDRRIAKDARQTARLATKNRSSARRDHGSTHLAIR